jgi:Uma2 family endonuclease
MLESNPVPKTRATYDEILRLPDNVVGEIVDGELFVSPRPASLHALAATVIGIDVGGPFHKGNGGPGGWWILTEPELHLGADVLVPDLAGWRRERMPRFPSVTAFELAPDWVCEIVSPGTARLDRGRKLKGYARAKVGHFWIVDPVARTLEALELAGPSWNIAAVHGGEEKVRVAPFADVELALAGWWPPDEPATAP